MIRCSPPARAALVCTVLAACIVAGCVLACPALAQDAEFKPVLVAMGEGAAMNWTELRLEVGTGSDKTVGAWKDRRVQEQDALERLAPKIAALAEEVCFTPDRKAGDLMEGTSDVSGRVRDGLRGWRIEETRYHSSGSVELDGVLDVRTWLRPALLSLAAARTPPVTPSGPTGVVVDARGLPFKPCLAPTIQSPDGTFVVRAQLVGMDAAQLSSPVLYVTDPADPRAARRAGDRPIFARAASVRGGSLVLDPASAVAIAGQVDGLAAEGRVVIVVQP